VPSVRLCRHKINGEDAIVRLKECACLALLGTALFSVPARSEITNNEVKIGVLTDMSGPFADATGKGSVEAAKMAVEDFGGTVRGKPITVIFGDHQNKPDVGSALARQWFEQQGVDVIVDLVGSAVALAVDDIAHQQNKATLITASGSPALVGSGCSPNTVLWTFDTRALAGALVKPLIDQGGKKWFFITVDYAFGHSLEQETSNLVKKLGGSVLGSIRHPLNNADFSSMLLQAQASGADIIALANTGADTANAIKQAHEFDIGTNGKQKLATLNIHPDDVHAVGQDTIKGLMEGTSFEWSLDQEKIDWSRRFFKRIGRMPSMNQAGTYSAVLNYLRAVDASGFDTTTAVIDQMKKMPTDDMFSKHGYIRPDGLHVHDMYLVRIKGQSEAKEAWDYYELVAKIPGEEAFGKPDASECPYVRQK
jgi:branched-chain amino acid transport system substrate-binding protein